MKLSPQVRTAMAEAYELACNGQTLQAGAITGVAAAPRLRIRTGAEPASTTAPRTGTVLVDMQMPADWMSNAAAGVKTLSNGPWTAVGEAAAGAGTNAGHYEIVSSDGTVVHESGTVTATGAGGELTLSNVSIASGQEVKITSKSLTMPNA